MLRFFSRPIQSELPEQFASRIRQAEKSATAFAFGKAARAELLERITTFLLDHDLDVTPDNLSLAHAALSGTNLDLAQRIAQRQLSGEPIDQQWLGTIAPSPRGDAPHDPHDSAQQAELDRLMGKLDTSLASFSAATSRARGTTAEYGQSLQEQVGRIAEADGASDVVASLAGIARAMLERTREVEQEMRRSSEEADSLRQSLERARREAEIDHLTGLPNRRAFEGVLETNFREAQREIDNLCVAFCDIDHFKAVNDTHGHDTGDRVIQAIGQVLSRISDDRCHVARHGGEEFVMLFRGRTVAEAQVMLDQAREMLAARRFINRVTDEPIGRVTFSGGIADVFSFAEPRDALRAADQALYRAKAEGRNRICTA